MRNKLKEAISDIEDRLKRIKEREIEGELLWEDISKNILTALHLFRGALEAYIRQCKILKTEVDQLSQVSQDDYVFYDHRISELYMCVNNFRRWFSLYFGQKYEDLLYLHFFLNELLLTFPVSWLREDINFIFVPVNLVVTWPLHKQMTEKMLSWYDEQVKEDLKKLESTEVYCIGAVPEQDLLAQAVLAHEIFHLIINKNSNIHDHIKDISAGENMKNMLPGLEPEVMESWTEELFCDFASSWHLGPVYGKAFIKEIVYYQSYGTETHPPRACRVLFILEALEIKKHPYITEIRNFRKRIVYEEEGQWSTEIKKIANKFRAVLQILKVYRYKYTNIRKLLRVKYFQNNLPYTYSDVRTFLNNLPKPADLPEKIKNDYDEILVECFRKNVIKREFEKAMEKTIL